MPALLTIARNSLWNSIDNWSELKVSPGDAYATVFNETYRFNDEMPLIEEIAPSLSDLPCLAIAPTSVVPAWWTNEMQQWPVSYDVVLWTQDWKYTEAEELIEKILNAFYRSVHPQGAISYIEAPSSLTPPGTGYCPMRLGPITFNRAKIGAAGPDGEALRCIVTTATIALRCQKDPFA